MARSLVLWVSAKDEVKSGLTVVTPTSAFSFIIPAAMEIKITLKTKGLANRPAKFKKLMEMNYQ